MIRKAIHFRRAPMLVQCGVQTGWDETEEIEVNGEKKLVWKDIVYEGGQVHRKGEQVDAYYFVPIRFFRKRPNKRAREVVRGDITWFTLPEPMSGHSRTNMVYGVTKYHSDGTCSSKTYWAEDGQVFSTSSRWVSTTHAAVNH